MFLFRWLFRALWVVGGIAAAVATYVLINFDPAGFQDRLTAALNEPTSSTAAAGAAAGAAAQAALGGARLSLPTPPQQVFTPTPTLRFRDVTLRRPLPGGRQEQVRIPEMDLALDVGALATGSVAVSRVIVRNPNVTVESNNRSNQNPVFAPLAPLAALGSLIPGNPQVIVDGGTLTIRDASGGTSTISLGTPSRSAAAPTTSTPSTSPAAGAGSTVSPGRQAPGPSSAALVAVVPSPLPGGVPCP